MNITRQRVRPDISDLRERNTAAIDMIRTAMRELPESSPLREAFDAEHPDAAAAFILSGVSSRASDAQTFTRELDRHYALTATNWNDVAEELLLPRTFLSELELLEADLGEEFTSYLSLDDDRIRERLEEDYVAIETTKAIYAFHRLVSRD